MKRQREIENLQLKICNCKFPILAMLVLAGCHGWLVPQSGSARADTDLPKKAGQDVYEGIPSVEAVQSGYLLDMYAQYKAAGRDRKAIYVLVDDHLELARAVLAHPNPYRRAIGLGIADVAADCAIRTLKDPKLAVLICDEVLLPNLDAGYKDHWREMSRHRVLKTLTFVYRTAGQTDKWVEAERLSVKEAPHRNSADGSRIYLAEALAARGDYEEAILQLEGVDENSSLASARSRIPQYREKLKERKQANASKKEGG